MVAPQRRDAFLRPCLAHPCPSSLSSVGKKQDTLCPHPKPPGTWPSQPSRFTLPSSATCSTCTFSAFRVCQDLVCLLPRSGTETPVQAPESPFQTHPPRISPVPHQTHVLLSQSNMVSHPSITTLMSSFSCQRATWLLCHPSPHSCHPSPVTEQDGLPAMPSRPGVMLTSILCAGI